MKIIISHDIDHLYWYDHLFDTWWYGLVRRTAREIIKRDYSLTVASKRLFPGKRLNHIQELTDFLEKNNIPATFFLGMKNGHNLSYNYTRTKPVIDYLRSRGFQTGVHGISYNDSSLMALEKRRFKDVSGTEPEGIRMHYLRMDNSTHLILNDMGYRYDSSEKKIDFPVKTGYLWSIPISIMDVEAVRGSRPEHLKTAINDSRLSLQKAQEKGIPYFVVNFHDLYFTSAYPNHKAWFIWIIDYLKKHQFEFISFRDAVKALDSL